LFLECLLFCDQSDSRRGRGGPRGLLAERFRSRGGSVAFASTINSQFHHRLTNTLKLLFFSISEFMHKQRITINDILLKRDK